MAASEARQPPLGFGVERSPDPAGKNILRVRLHQEVDALIEAALVDDRVFRVTRRIEDFEAGLALALALADAPGRVGPGQTVRQNDVADKKIEIAGRALSSASVPRDAATTV